MFSLLTYQDGGGTLWKWVSYCQARITADLNNCLLTVTAAPRNLKKLEWLIHQMFKVVTIWILSLTFHRTLKMKKLISIL